MTSDASRPTFELSSRDELGHFLNDLELVGEGVEVGVFRGDFAKTILQAWLGSRLSLVDSWRQLADYRDNWNLPDPEMERNYHATLENVAAFKDRVRIIRALSVEAPREFADGSCDFIYIDANHGYDSVRADLAAWYPKLRRGGLFCGHDYFDAATDENLKPIRNGRSAISRDRLTSYGVKSAVDEFAASIQARVSATDELDPTWYFIKD